jgi:putative ribosome biogenesis GTPase RsgA
MPDETVDELIEQLKRIKLQESSVLERLTQARRRESDVQRTGYVEGDRVRINNTIKAPFGRLANSRDRTATVLHTRTTNNQTKVFIRTDNGAKTWRLEKNLSRIQ